MTVLLIFSEKGLQAAYGNNVPLEDPTVCEGENAGMMALNEASQRLLSVLAREEGDARPRSVADAQYYYDCWHDQAAHAGSESAFCQEKFEEVMESLHAAQAPATPDTAAEVRPSQLSYLVYFALNRAELSDAGRRVLESIVTDLKSKGQGVEVVISGHTDTSGDDKYNMALSHRRAGVVKAALQALGVDTGQISTFGFGETDPIVKTGDGVVEEKNRRAEIVIN